MRWGSNRKWGSEQNKACDVYSERCWSFFFFLTFKNHIVLFNGRGRSSCLFLKAQLLKRPMERVCGGCKTSLGKMQTALPLLCLAKGMQIHVSVLRGCLILLLHFSLPRAEESYLNCSSFRPFLCRAWFSSSWIEDGGESGILPPHFFFFCLYLSFSFPTHDFKKREDEFSN